MVSMAPAAATTAIVRLTTKPVERAVRQALATSPPLLGHRESHTHARAATLARAHLGFAAELHRQAMDQRQAEPALGARTERPPVGVDAIVLDHELDFLSL